MRAVVRSPEHSLRREKGTVFSFGGGGHIVQNGPPSHQPPHDCRNDTGQYIERGPSSKMPP